ncbi:MAG: protein kinase domain-containing protein [Byssovorax sp.]
MKTCPQCHLAYPSESSFCFVDGKSLVSPKDSRIGSTVAGRYVIDEALGKGGMATVYRAHHKLVDRPCAIKVLSAQFAQDPTTRERFRREARHAQRLAHPNIIEIFDQGETEDGVPFLVMELLQGSTLSDVLEKGRLPIGRALSIGIEMSRALARAHDFEVIHRDLKPENVFLLPGDHVKLLDFGIARCTQDARLTNLGEIFGTPQYMAPERGSSIDAGPPADLYALGFMIFEMLTGQLPFTAPDAASWLMKHLKEAPPHLRQFFQDAPEALDRLLFELMAKRPEDRPVDAHRVEAALSAIARNLGISVPPEAEPLPPPSSMSLRNTAHPWERRTAIFDRMMARSFGGAAPADVARQLDTLKGHLREIAALRAGGFEEQQRLETIENEGRDGRLRLGKAMDTLTSDVSRTREEARGLRAGVAPLAEESKTFAPQVILAHKDLMGWEGRSGFAEPTRELAAAYGKLSELVGRWYEVRRRELEADGEAVKKERVIADVDAQIKALRGSLATLDRSLEERRQKIQQKISEMGRRTELLEGELLHVASRFCGPLRSKPELGQLFLELEKVV